MAPVTRSVDDLVGLGEPNYRLFVTIIGCVTAVALAVATAACYIPRCRQRRSAKKTQGEINASSQELAPRTPSMLSRTSSGSTLVQDGIENRGDRTASLMATDNSRGCDMSLQKNDKPRFKRQGRRTTTIVPSAVLAEKSTRSRTRSDGSRSRAQPASGPGRASSGRSTLP